MVPIPPFHCQFCWATRIVFRFRSLCPCHHHLILSHLITSLSFVITSFGHFLAWMTEFQYQFPQFSLAALPSSSSSSPSSSSCLLLLCQSIGIRHPAKFSLWLCIVFHFFSFSLFSSPSLASFLILFFFPDFSFSCLYLLIAPLLHQL